MLKQNGEKEKEYSTGIQLVRVEFGSNGLFFLAHRNPTRYPLSDHPWATTNPSAKD